MKRVNNKFEVTYWDLFMIFVVSAAMGWTLGLLITSIAGQI